MKVYSSMFACILAALAWIVPLPQSSLPTVVSVLPDRIVVEETGQTIKPSGGRSPLAEALERIPEGGVIQISGSHPGITIGSGSTSGKFSVYRSTPLDVTVIGDGTFSLPAITFSGGVKVAYFELSDYTIRGRGVQRPIVVDMGTNQGKLVFRHGVHQSDGKTQFAVRGHGTATWKFVNVDFSEAGQEHAGYLDNVQGAEIYSCLVGPWGRTGFQFVARTYPPTNKPPSGDIFIAGNRIIGTGSAGGSAITIAGHIGGEVHIGAMKNGKRKQNTISSKEKTGAIVAYLDEKQFLLKNPTAPLGQRVKIGPGYTIEGKWAVESIHVYDPAIILENSDRFLMAFGSVKELRIHISREESTYIRGPKSALDVAHNGFKCESIGFHGKIPPSEWDWVTGQPEFVMDKTPFDPDPFWVSRR